MARSQYITVAQLYNAPLGIDLKSVVPPQAAKPGSQVSGMQLYEELQQIVLRASAMIDNYCQQVLRATTDSEEKWTGAASRAGVDQNGYLWVRPNYWPVRSVSAFQYGCPAIGGTSWTVPTLSDLLIINNRIVYPSWLPARNTPPWRVQYTYINGYVTALLTASMTASATAMPVNDATGMTAGQTLTIYDAGNTEDVTVAASWTPTTGAASVTLAAATTFAHTIQARPTTGTQQPYDIMVSALPAEVQQACLLICKELVEARGASALVMGRTGGVSGGQPQHGASAETEKFPLEAQYALDPYRRVL